MGRKPAGQDGEGGKPLLKFDPPVSRTKVSVNIKDQVNAWLDKYPQFVETATGVKVSRDDVAEQILERFFKSDKAFMASLTQATGSSSGARPAPARSAPASTPPAPSSPTTSGK